MVSVSFKLRLNILKKFPFKLIVYLCFLSMKLSYAFENKIDIFNVIMIRKGDRVVDCTALEKLRT